MQKDEGESGKHFHKRKNLPSATSLSHAAAYYLARYAATEQDLQRVLQNKILRAARADLQFAADAELQEHLRQTIEGLIVKYKKAGVLNDVQFAVARTEGMRRQGASKQMILRKLRLRGVSAAIIEDALTQTKDMFTEQGPPLLGRVIAQGVSGESVELKAAEIYARRKGLGPFRKRKANWSEDEMLSEDEPKGAKTKHAVELQRARKDLAAMARAGFSFEVARKILQFNVQEDDILD